MIRFLPVLICLLGTLFLVGMGDKPRSPGHLSPQCLAVDDGGANLYITQYTGKSVAIFDLHRQALVGRIDLAAGPTGLALHPDGKRLFVTAGCPGGRIYEIDIKQRKVTRSLTAGHSPRAPVMGFAGKTLHYCDRFTNRIITLDLVTGKELWQVKAGREPIALALNPDKSLLVAANLLPAGAADRSYTAASVTLIDPRLGELVGELALPNGTTGVRGLALSPDGKEAYITHILARYHLPTTQLARGWMNTNALTVVDLVARRVLNTVLLDDVDRGAANPWGVAVSSDGERILVAHAGSHALSLIDRPALLKKLRGLEKKAAAEVANDLSFMVGLKRRLPLPGKGPRGLSVVGDQVYGAMYFSDSLVRLQLKGAAKPVAIPLGPKLTLGPERRGEACFHDAALCFQEWQSCSSCHPDARADGLNWDLVNDGFGNPKNTKSLLLAHRTPPAMVTGIRDRAETAVRAGIRHIQFAARPEAEARAIDSWLKSLEPIPSPFLLGGNDQDVGAGREIFAKSGCVICHPAPLHTNLKSYALKLGKDQDRNRPFDTPTLVEIWRTGPYLYDGRAKTLEQVIGKHNPGDHHGQTSKLTVAEKELLLRYLRGL